MSGTDEYERWLEGSHDAYQALFEDTLDSLKLKPPVSVASHASLRVAIDLMNDNGIGCVLVVDDDALVGIFTERDVLRRVAPASMNLALSTVEDFMTARPEVVEVSDRVAHALHLMAVGGYRHVPVVDGGRAVGVFGMRDVVNFIADEHPDQVINVPPPGLSYSNTREGA